jgi:ribosome-binding protein aMBF1 (putative translation factor)
MREEICQLCSRVLTSEDYVYCIMVEGHTLLVCLKCTIFDTPISMTSPTLPQESPQASL